MTLPTETMEERFKKKFTYLGRNQIDQQEWLLNPSTKPYEIMDFIQSELSLSQNRILEEVEKELEKWDESAEELEDGCGNYTVCIPWELKEKKKDIIKLISKKDNQSTLTKGN